MVHTDAVSHRTMVDQRVVDLRELIEMLGGCYACICDP